MRLRAFASVSVLTVTVLGATVSSAPAATLFTNATHATRVTFGATLDATTIRSVDFTSPPGTIFNRCNHSALHLHVRENTDTRVALTVTGGTLVGCTPSSYTGTFPWTFTVTGNGTVSGTSVRYAATAHRVAFDLSGVGLFSGNLETGVTASQPTAGTAPICLDLAGAGTLSGPVSLTLDTRYCLVGAAAAWSLTN